METYNYKRKIINGLFWGLAVIGIGVVYLLSNLGILDNQIMKVIISWQMLILAISISSLIKRHIFGGIFGIIISVYFLIPHISKYYPNLIGIEYGGIDKVFLPLLIIILGLFLLIFLMGRGSKKNNCFKEYKKYNHVSRRDGNGTERDIILGSSRQVVLSPELNISEVNVVLGSMELDLRKTNIKEGETNLDINVVLGNCQVFVPSDWNVLFRGANVLSNIDDKRIYNEDTNEGKKLIITGGCVMGKIEIKN